MKKTFVAFICLSCAFFAFADDVFSYVSPTNSGVSDNLVIPLQIRDKRFVSEWRIEISDESNQVVHIIRNKENREKLKGVGDFVKKLFAPKPVLMFPKPFAGTATMPTVEKPPTEPIFFQIFAKDDNGNETITNKFKFIIDSKMPEIKISVPDRFRLEYSEDIIFAPGSEGE